MKGYSRMQQQIWLSSTLFKPSLFSSLFSSIKISIVSVDFIAKREKISSWLPYCCFDILLLFAIFLAKYFLYAEHCTFEEYFSRRATSVECWHRHFIISIKTLELSNLCSTPKAVCFDRLHREFKFCFDLTRGFNSRKFNKFYW